MDDEHLFGEKSYCDSDSFKQAIEDLQNLPDEDFLHRYRGTKQQYQTILDAIKQLEETKEALVEMSDVGMDAELIENTQLLFEDYVQLLERMQMASYWACEGI